MAKAKKTTEVKEKKARGNKKEKSYFKVDDEKIFDILEKLKKKKDIEVDLVTCTELKITWLSSKYTKEEIEKFLK